MRNSQNYSYDGDNFNDSRFFHNFEIPEKEKECKRLRSDKKDEFIEKYVNINDINKHMENLSLMFYNYVKEAGKEIIKIKKENYKKHLDSMENILKFDYEHKKKKNDDYHFLDKDIKYTMILNTEEGLNESNPIINEKINNPFLVKIGHLIVNLEMIKDFPLNDLGFNNGNSSFRSSSIRKNTIND